MMTVVLVLKDKSTKTRERAYRELRYSDAVRQYFPRFVHHGPVQACVMAGRVLFMEAPDVIVKQIMNDLSGSWQQGTADDLAQELAERNERMERARRGRETTGAEHG